MVTIYDLVELQITKEVDIMSLWMAQRRILYEYPEHDPETFGEYDKTHIPVIQKGIIGELLTFDYLHTKLKEKFGELDPSERWKAVRDKLCLENKIGDFDTGYDLTIKTKTIDVKTYHKGRPTKDEMMGLNLLVNVQEVKNKPSADFYIQTFFTPSNSIVLAGCHQGLPPNIGYRFPSPAYACLVRNLKPISTLVELLLESE